MYTRVVVTAFFLCISSIECKVCTSLDIRNNPHALERLRNCTEIAGYLQILLMEKVTSEYEFDDYVFPELTQISGYLLFYNVRKLTSVAKLFPNLRVIRGMQLFTDYALVIYGMPDIREIGTQNLMYIARGLVKVDKCPKLCFVDTIKWEKIGAAKLHFNNMNNGTCEACPRNCGDYCWNAEQCQRLNVENCHRECLGCQAPYNPRKCDACKNYDDDGTCVEICPKDKFIHRVTNRCITEFECRSWNKTAWWIFGNNCVNECPAYHEEYYGRDGTKGCRYCGDNCTRYCTGKEITNAIRLEAMKGCTHINGSILIHLKDESVEKLEAELTNYLGSIKYIRDNLIIRRTKAIRSLNFFKNLTVIAGENLINKLYAVFVYENPNLQMLWNFDDPEFKLEIKSGTIAFHDNPLLCLSEIEKLANVTELKYNSVDVSWYSNGEKAACVTKNMTVRVEVSSYNATLSWNSTESNETIGYTVFYKPYDDGDNSTMDSQESCVSSPWSSIFTSNTTVVLTKLLAYTKYAFYIKVSQSWKNGSQSQMMYFETEPDDPETFGFFMATPVDHKTIQLEWSLPLRENGILAYYKVNYNEEPDLWELSDRDFCKHPKDLEGNTVDLGFHYFSVDDFSLIPQTSDKSSSQTTEDNCTCPLTYTPRKPENVLEFDDYTILNFDKRYELCDIYSQSKFQTNNCGELAYVLPDSKSDKFVVQKRRLQNPQDVFRYEPNPLYGTNVKIDPNVTIFNITDLKHFTLYIFYHSACNNPTNGKERCSVIRQSFARTARWEEADDVENVTVSVENANVEVTWSEPRNPNSVVVAYRVKYWNDDGKQLLPVVDCLARTTDSNTNTWRLINLDPGNYNLQVQAESLAGYGRYSRSVNFYIESATSVRNTIVIVVMTLIICFSIGVSIFVYWWYKRKYQDDIHLITTINPDYDGTIYVEDEWEIDRSDVELQEDLGHGTFGIVYYGKIKSKNLPCAVKTANENLGLHERMQFLNEASVMKAFSNCHHVIKLLGVVSKGQPPLVIMELMERGDLKKYLRRTRDSSHTLTSNEIYRMAVEIADGMAYLSAKKFVHRDLAARNCMVASDRTVKIGDFGMTRDIYETDYYRKETRGLLPVRWMAPESLADGVFTSDSDVWSYGIVLWEIATLAEQPYQGLSNEQVLQFVVSKGRLLRPSECSDLLYEIMRQCWSWRPNDRPTFWDVVEKLEDHVGQDFKLLSFIHSREGHEHRIIHGRQRAYNPPPLSVEPQEELFGRYNVSDDEVSLHVGGVPRRTSFLQSSSLRRNPENRFSPTEFY